MIRKVEPPDDHAPRRQPLPPQPRQRGRHRLPGKDGRWEAAGYVLAVGDTRKRVRVYGAPARTPPPSSPRRSPPATAASSPPSAQGSVAAFLTYWLETVALHRLHENTHTRYTACTRLYLLLSLGRKKLAKLTAKDVHSWLDQLRTTCQCCARGLDTARDQPQCCAVEECCSKRLSPLRPQVRPGARVREEAIPRNVRMGTPRPRRFGPLTAAEARAFPTTTHGHRLHALFKLPLRTGLRKGELLGLRWEDLDLAGGTASIRRTLQRTNSSGLTALPTKTQSSEQRIALPTPCLRSLEQHRDQQRQERGAVGASWKDSGYVFTRPDGSPIEGATLTRHFNTLLRRATLRRIRIRIRFHDLRHSAATLLLEQGVELVVIKKLLGHAHIEVTTTVYAHVRLRLQRQAIDTLSNVLRHPADATAESDDGDDPPLCAAPVH